MHQHRWTCLATLTLVLTTVLAPISTVYARTSSSPGMDLTSSNLLTQPSLPIVTPLTVTELETDAAIPALPAKVAQIPPTGALPKVGDTKGSEDRQIKPVPAVTSLTPSPQIATNTPIFDPTFQITSPGFSGSDITDLFTATPRPITSPAPVGVVVQPQFQPVKVNPVLALPILPVAGSLPSMAAPQIPQSFTIRSVGNPVLVVRNGNAPAAIINTITAQAEFARLPQIAPSIGPAEDLSDVPTFEAGIPTVAFERTRPQQIIATSIAQIGTSKAAPEPSVAIPFQPKSPVLAQSNVAPQQPSTSVEPPSSQIVATQTGKASWYGPEGGPKTANGENYNPDGLTAAHRTLPFGTQVRVISVKTGKSVTVRINDRGPFRSNRIIDVSAAAAEAIGIKQDGIGTIKMEVFASN